MGDFVDEGDEEDEEDMEVATDTPVPLLLYKQIFLTNSSIKKCRNLLEIASFFAVA
jgi:hypothetical protein